jgi:hypothetical protein
MRKFYLLFVIPALLALATPASAGEFKLSIENGLVTLTADDVPLSAIMAEWARVGQTRIVNGEKVSTPVSIRIADMPERRALDILLRAVSGYIVAERPTPIAGASVFDRIMILPTSRPPANTGPINTSAPPMFTPRPAAPAIPDMDDEPVLPPGVSNQPQPNMPQGAPQPMVPVPGQQFPPNANAPLTAPRPGQLPAPTPQQPVPFGTPVGTPAKPGGGGGSGGGGF